jgi:hypothetical protein
MARRLLAVVLGAALMAPRGAEACAVCFGAKGQPVTEAAGGAILFLLGLVACVLASFAAFMIYLAVRARRAAAGTEVSR